MVGVEHTAFKRKKCRALETDSHDESASDLGDKKACARIYTVSRKKASVRGLAQPKVDEGDEDPSCSTQDGAPSGTDSEGKRSKVGRPRCKIHAFDPILVEQEILQKRPLML